MDSPQGRYHITTMARSDLDFAVELAAQEGWNPGLHDADCFYRADPDGFFLGVLDGKPIGCISGVSYGGVFGFIGFYIVVPQHRGQGYGIRLWNQAIDHLSGHNIGLDGVVEQQPNYQKSGFKLAYRNVRYEGAAGPARPDAPGITALGRVPFEELRAYDRAFFPADRGAFLRCWTAMPESKAIAYVEDRALAGYGVVRRCRRGYKIGPLFADTAEIADALFASLASHAEEGAPIYLDVPESNPAAVALAQRRRMAKVFETARMYTGQQPPIALDRLFGVTTFELG